MMRVFMVTHTLWVVLFVHFASAGEINITNPKRGWRNSKGEKTKFTQVVNYPASSVNMQDKQSTAAMIKGNISGAEKGTDPYQLIVNGISMPMRPSAGAFNRPYSFGSGSNSVEVRSPDGKTRARTQFYEAYADGAIPKIRVLLSWDTDGTDLDLHVVSPDGQHCYYGNRVVENGGGLDVDVTTGYGPEIFATPAPLKGTYMVFVNYYGSGSRDDLTVASITMITNESTVDEKVQSYKVPLRSAGELTLVGTFVYP